MDDMGWARRTQRQMQDIGIARFQARKGSGSCNDCQQSLPAKIFVDDVHFIAILNKSPPALLQRYNGVRLGLEKGLEWRVIVVVDRRPEEPLRLGNVLCPQGD